VSALIFFVCLPSAEPYPRCLTQRPSHCSALPVHLSRPLPDAGLYATDSDLLDHINAREGRGRDENKRAIPCPRS